MEICSFVEGMNYRDFLKDRRIQNAIIRSFEVVGEASRRVTTELWAKAPDTPWRRMIDFRNKLIHDYFGLDLFLIWKTAIEEVLPHYSFRVNV